MSGRGKFFWFLMVLIFLVIPNTYLFAPLIKDRILPKPEVKLVFVGDIMLDRGVLSSVNRNFGGDFNSLFDNTSFIKEADLAFANLEGPASDKGANVGSIYSFRMKPISLEALASAGFDVLSVANNHAGDWGLEAFVDTLEHIKKSGLEAIGGASNYSLASKVLVKEVKGTKIGFLAFSDTGPRHLSASATGPGILLASDPNYSEIIKTGASEVDVLVVSIHFGEEYQTKSNDRQQYLSRLAIDSGAKIVVGHHPHVIQEIERYKDGVIAYSLGNFIFDQYFSAETMEGGVLEMILDNKTIKSTELKKVILNNQYQPALVGL